MLVLSQPWMHGLSHLFHLVHYQIRVFKDFEKSYANVPYSVQPK